MIGQGSQEDELLQIYKDLELTYDKAVEFLKENEHDRVIKIFEHFFRGDLEMKEKVASALTGQVEFDQDRLMKITQIGGYYSNFHIMLFDQITDRLVDMFKDAMDVMELDMDEGSRQSFNAHRTIRRYEIQLEKLMAPIDTYQGSMYTSLIESYKIVQERRDQNLEEITKQVILQEAKLQEKMMGGQL